MLTRFCIPWPAADSPSVKNSLELGVRVAYRARPIELAIQRVEHRRNRVLEAQGSGCGFPMMRWGTMTVDGGLEVLGQLRSGAQASRPRDLLAPLGPHETLGQVSFPCPEKLTQNLKAVKALLSAPGIQFPLPSLPQQFLYPSTPSFWLNLRARLRPMRESDGLL